MVVDMDHNWVDAMPHHFEAPITLYSTVLLYNHQCIGDFIAVQRQGDDITGNVCVGRIIDFHVHEHQAHLNWFHHSNTIPAALRACIPIVPHFKQIIQVPEVAQTLESEWILEDQIKSLAFMFHYKAIKAGEVDCCGVDLAWFIRFHADEVTSAMEWLPWENCHFFSDSLGVGSEDSYIYGGFGVELCQCKM